MALNSCWFDNFIELLKDTTNILRYHGLCWAILVLFMLFRPSRHKKTLLTIHLSFIKLDFSCKYLKSSLFDVKSCQLKLFFSDTKWCEPYILLNFKRTIFSIKQGMPKLLQATKISEKYLQFSADRVLSNLGQWYENLKKFYGVG